MLSVPLPSNS